MSSLPTALPRGLLAADEEADLAARMEAGVLAADALARGARPAGASAVELGLLVERGEVARRRLIETNLRLVAMVTFQSSGRSGLPAADLFQEGCLGLVQAVLRFDHRRGCRFATYALFWIRAFVSAASAARLGDLNLPASRAAQLRTVRGVESLLTQQLGRPATVAEIAAAVGRSVEWTGRLLAQQAPEPLDLATEAELLAAPEPGSPAEAVQRAEVVRDLLGRLPPADRRLLELRLGFTTGEPLSYAAVASRLGLSISRVRRAERAALAALRGVCPQSAAAHL